MIIALLILFGALQIADGYTTYKILSAGGKELNPFMRLIMDKLGMVQGLVLMKLLAVALVAAVFNETLTFWLCVLYIGIVGWNVHHMVKE